MAAGGRRHGTADQQSPASADIVIIGGGLAGVSAALAVIERRPAASIAVLEQKFVGYGASGRNGGLLSPLPVPVWLLTADANADHAWALQTLNRKLHELGAWLAATVPESEVTPCHAAASVDRALDASGLGVIAQTLDRCRIDHRMITQARGGGGPVLALPSLYGASLPAGTRTWPHGLPPRERSSANRLPSRRSTLPRVGVRIRLADGMVVEAGQVLVCTNAYTHSILGPSPPRAKVVRNYMVETEPFDDEAIAQLGGGKTFIVELNKSYIFYRVHQRRLIYGGVETFFGAAKSDYEVPAEVMQKLEKHLAHSVRWRHEPLADRLRMGRQLSFDGDGSADHSRGRAGRRDQFQYRLRGNGRRADAAVRAAGGSRRAEPACGDDDDTRSAAIVDYPPAARRPAAARRTRGPRYRHWANRRGA